MKAKNCFDLNVIRSVLIWFLKKSQPYKKRKTKFQQAFKIMIGGWCWPYTAVNTLPLSKLDYLIHKQL